MDRVRAQLMASRQGRGTGVAALAAALAFVTACDAGPREVTARPSTVPSGLAEFRASLPRVERLEGGARSAEELMRRVVAAAATNDTTALVRMAITRAEWAWLHYPESPLARPPYQSPADVQWYLSVQASDKGLRRLLRELGDATVAVTRVECPTVPEPAGANRLWTGCRVSYRDMHGPATRTLVRSVIERGRTFKVLSYANDF